MWYSVFIAGIYFLATICQASAQSDQVFDQMDELGRINERLQDRNVKLEKENRDLRERLRRYEPVQPAIFGVPPNWGSSVSGPPRPGAGGGASPTTRPAPLTPLLSASIESLGSVSASGIISFDSDPKGAEVQTSLGSGCQTPCEMEISTDRAFAVTFVHTGYEPANVQIQLQAGKAGVSGAQFLPNPVSVQLAPAAKKKPTSQAPKLLR
jgi:hypothetical protein